MTVLVGRNSPPSGGTGATSGASGKIWFPTGGYGPATDGIVATLNIYVNSIGAATTIWLGLYNSGGNALGGGVTAIHSGQNIVSGLSAHVTGGNTYFLTYQADADIVVADDGSSAGLQTNVHTFGSIPGSIVIPGASGGVVGLPSIWADGAPTGSFISIGGCNYSLP